ncbi:MAG: formate--tetrahydrofolate ligase, partial [Candidatus Eisenbacteria bacterium]
PEACVIVATVRALKMHGGADKKNLAVSNAQQVRAGFANLARHVDCLPEDALAETNAKFERRFRHMEQAVADQGKTPQELDLEGLEARGVGSTRTVLHVGPGTFRPVTAADPREHRMDEEYFEVTGEAAAALVSARAAGGRIVAVGTTVVRALESACDANGGRLGAAAGWTRKFILPPYEFRAVDALLTNFHLPRTTLLLLVAALTGKDLLRRAYAHAVEERYRFYSYGDAMLVV